jgi:hypothetical protein
MNQHLPIVETYVDEVLGKWSSHPKARNRRRKWSRWLVVLCIGLIALLGNFMVRHSLRGALMTARLAPLLPWIIIACAGFLALLMTQALSDKIAYLKALADQRGASTAPQTASRIRWVGLILLALLPAISAVFLTVSPTPPEYLKWAAQLWTILPIALLLASIWRREIELRPEMRWKRRVWLTWLFVLSSLLLMFLVANDLSTWIRGSPVWDWIYNKRLPLIHHAKPLLAAAILFPFWILLLAVWQLWRVAVPIRETAMKEEQVRIGLFKRLRIRIAGFFSWIVGKFTGRGRKKTKDIRPVDWLDEYLGQESESVSVSVIPAQGEPEEAAEFAERNPLSPFFFPHPFPTKDQARAFGRFTEMADTGNRFADDAAWPPGSNLFLFGPGRSGQSTILRACAVYSVFAAGRHVLFVVSSRERATSVAHDINSQLHSLRVGTVTKAAPFTAEALDHWLRGEITGLPQILVLSLESYVSGFIQSVDEGQEMLQSQRRIVTLFDTILVDDFLKFTNAERSHLQFLLGTHRLMLASRYLSMRTVVALGNVKRSVVGDIGFRLFGEAEFHVGDDAMEFSRIVREPKPGQKARPKPGRHVVTDNPVDTTLNMLRASVGSSSRISVRSAEPFVHQEIMDKIRNEAGLNKSSMIEFRLIGDPEQQSQTHEADVILLPLQLTAKAPSILADAKPEAAVVYISSSPSIDRPDEPAHPVIARRTAEGFRTAYVKNSAVLIPHYLPLPSFLWKRSGLAIENLDSAGETLVNPVFSKDDGQIDDPILSECLFVSRNPDRRDKIESDYVPWQDSRLVRDDNRTRALFVQVEESSGVSHTGRWIGESGEHLQSFDPAFLHVAKCRHNEQTLGVRIPPELHGHEIEFSARMWSGTKHEPLLPVFAWNWTLPDDLQSRVRGGGLTHHSRWLEFEPSVRIEGCLHGFLSPDGGFSAVQEVKFNYSADFSAIILKPTKLDPQEMGERLCTGLKSLGAWSCSTECDFLPEMSAGFRLVLGAKLLGASYFARYFVFGLKDEHPDVGQGVVWIVEPSNVGHASIQGLSDLLENPETRVEFQSQVRGFLDWAKSRSPSTLPAILSEAAFSGLLESDSMRCNASLDIL